MKDLIQYKWLPSTLVDEPMINKCSELYSNHYGYWNIKSDTSKKKRVKLSPQRIKEWLATKHADLYYAEKGEKLIGYAIVIRIKLNYYGVISWVSQLVVHEKYRKKNIAKTLMFSIWGFSDHYAWGLISANPYAIRALEKATRRRCNPRRIKKNKDSLLEIGKNNLPYINDDTEIILDNKNSKINTLFELDHSELKEMIKSVTTIEVPWLIGYINEGWEWFAFTFKDQEQINLSNKEITEMLQASDHITAIAYSRMDLGENHLWMKNTQKEVEFISKYLNLTKADKILDIGCGIGRHSIALASKVRLVFGIDYIPELIERAEKHVINHNLKNVKFKLKDCRFLNKNEIFDHAICLYDVIGSYADEKENIKILKSIYDNLKSGGKLLMSVMNYDVTEHNAIYKFRLSETPNKLLELEPSSIMEQTGNIFDPNFYLVDTETHIVYRKEQFSKGLELPKELLVRDRRFTKEEIINMCKTVGFETEWLRFVQSGKWDIPLDSKNDKAKEILLLCTKK